MNRETRDEVPQCWKDLLEQIGRKRIEPLRKRTGRGIAADFHGSFPVEGSFWRKRKIFLEALFITIPDGRTFSVQCFKASSSSRKASSPPLLRLVVEGQPVTGESGRIRASVFLGAVYLDPEDFFELSPGTELEFSAPAEWKVTIQIGRIPVASGRFRQDNGRSYLLIDEVLDFFREEQETSA